MKKLLLVIAIISVVACMFAISVSAEDIVANTITSDDYGTIIQLSQDPGLDNAHLYASTLKTIEDQGKDTDAMAILFDGTFYYVFPSSYLIDEYSNGKFSLTLKMGMGSNFSKSQKGINDAIEEFNAAEGTNIPTFTVTGAWGNTRVEQLVRFEFTSDVTWIDRQHCLLKSATSLVEVRFPHKVNLNGAAGLFGGCTALTTVVGLDTMVGSNIANAGAMFSSCTSLVSVSLPSDMTAIPNEMFYNCTSFKGVANWNELTNLKSIGTDSFRATVVVSIAIPEGVTKIDSKAFYDCKSLETITLPSTLTTLAGNTFRNDSKLQRVELPEGITVINSDTFYGCSSLTYCNVPSSCKSIGNYAFNGCASLVTLDMTQATSLKSTGSNTFGGCSSLTSLIFPEGFESFGGISSASSLTEIYFPNSTVTMVGIQAAGKLSTVKIPLGVTKLGSKAFDHSGVKTLIIHEGVTSIDSNAFFGTNGINTIIYVGNEGDGTITALTTRFPNATVIYADKCETYLGGHSWRNENNVSVTSYFAEISVGDSCSVCEKIDVKSTIAPIFVWKGYSKSTFGETYSVVQGFYIDREALAQYKVYAPDFDFGIMATGNAKGEAINPQIGDEKVFTAIFDNTVNDYYDIKVTGITEELLDKNIVFCIYVLDGGKMYYLDGEKTGESVIGISYNAI